MSRKPIPTPPTETAKAAAPRARRSVKGTPPAPHEILGALAAPVQPGKSASRAVIAVAPKPKRSADPKPTEKKRSERTKALNFSVTVNFRKAFKLAAEAQNCKKVELLEMIFAEWQNRHPV